MADSFAAQPATPGLPPIAAHADDLEAIKKTVEDAASVSGGLWLSYLLALFYLATATGAVTHTDLFLENPVKLPFFNLELPLKAFFVLAPLLFVVIHIYTLTYFVILSSKARWYHDELHRQIAEEDDPASAVSVRARDVRERLQRQLPANIFVQFLAGPAEIRRSAFGLLLKTVAWTTLVISPVLLLLLMQLQVLAYHSRAITWAIRLLLLVDLAVVWWLWHIILLGQGEFREMRRTVSKIGTIVGTFASVSVLVFSWGLATFPGETIETVLGGWRPFRDIDAQGKTIHLSLHDALFHRHISPTTRRRGILSDTLVLPVFDINAELKAPPPTRTDIHRFVFHARGRDLRGAVFDYAILSNIDFEGAHLEEASLARADLKSASLYCAHMQGASLYYAELQNTSFYAADLRGAELRFVSGQGAVLEGAHLEGATLVGSHFEGASFRSAYLAAAGLMGAHLEEASFERMALGGECIDDEAYKRQVQHGVDLRAANLSGAHLDGASLRGAQLEGASLKDATLDQTDLSGAFLWRTDLSGVTPNSASHVKITEPVWAPMQGDSSNASWRDVDYRQLTKVVGGVVPTDVSINPVPIRLAALDCANLKQVPCDPGRTLSGVNPPARKILEAGVRDAASYDAALLAGIQTLLCSGDPDARFILRGLLENERLHDAALHGTAILATIPKQECLVSKSLSEDDKARLIGLDRRLTAKGAPR